MIRGEEECGILTTACRLPLPPVLPALRRHLSGRGPAIPPSAACPLFVQGRESGCLRSRTGPLFIKSAQDLRRRLTVRDPPRPEGSARRSP
jgi:hypothetical protein